jgi:type IV pilus assembly protein PilW
MPFEIVSSHARIGSWSPRAQRGVTLIELLMGMTLGLLVVAVAVVALMVSRGVSGTVSDASNIQQQAAHALRVIGGQLRQAGSLYLAVLPPDTTASTNPIAQVGFEIKAEDPEGIFNFDLEQPETLLFGKDGGESDPDTLIVGFRRYREPVFAAPPGASATSATLARNCLGTPSDDKTDNDYQRIQSEFKVAVDKAGVPQLQCVGNGATPTVAPQPIIENVANFQVRYLVQDVAVPDAPKLQYVNAGSVTNWAAVQGVEVCLVLYGDERTDMPAGSTYTDCDGKPKDMTAAAVPQARRNHMHLVFRNVFQLRSMGVAAS